MRVEGPDRYPESPSLLFDISLNSEKFKDCISTCKTAVRYYG